MFMFSTKQHKAILALAQPVVVIVARSPSPALCFPASQPSNQHVKRATHAFSIRNARNH